MPQKILFLLQLFIGISVSAQTLNLPPRDVNALEGSEVVTAITPLSLYDREVYIKNEVLNGNVPDFIRDMVLVTDSAFISGSYKYISYYVIPDYLALGSDTNYFLCPMTPILAQQLADSLDCLLPSRKMVDNIWSHAAVKMNPESIPPSPAMTTVPVFDDHNTMVYDQRITYPETLGSLVSGNKKDVIISNLIYTSPPPARVVIYGWHYQNGTNIQPMYAGHIDTYADYSHGIRMVQDQCWVDGVPMLASNVLADPTLYPLLSDEGAITLPFYPDTSGTTVPSPPATPSSFVVINESTNSVRVKISNDPNTGEYNVFTSTDGLSFSLEGSYTSNDFVLTGLSSDQIVYVRLSASNNGGTSNQSEVLAAVPTSIMDTVLIVNGFDRTSTGNTKDFIRQHGESMFAYGSGFSSATNDAVVDGLIDLTYYRVVDYILEEDSNVDETFDFHEQGIIESYLEQGGMLFVSGAEIGWDLDHLGSTTDQSFYHDYLKAEYVLDAPGDQFSTYYQFEEVQDSIFNGLGVTDFDNGTNGTYNVDYPDVINGINGGINGLYYSGLNNEYAGVYFEGIFPNGVENGKLVYFSFPFETVYPSTKRNDLMSMVMQFFEDDAAPIDSTGAYLKENELDVQIYPNPFRENFNVRVIGSAKYEIYNSLGQLISSDMFLNYTIIQTSGWSPGLYLMKIQCEKGLTELKLMKN